MAPDVSYITGDGRRLTNAEWEDRLDRGSRFVALNSPGWQIDGEERLESSYMMRDVGVATRPNDYVPFQSIFDPCGRYAYDPQGERYPRYASDMPETGPRPFTRAERQRHYAENRPSLERYPHDHTFDLMGEESGWFGSRRDGPFGADTTRLLRRPEDYRPLQSLDEREGRYAYDPRRPQYPQFDAPDQIMGREARHMPSLTRWPRDTIMEMEMRPESSRRGPPPRPLPPWRRP